MELLSPHHHNVSCIVCLCKCACVVVCIKGPRLYTALFNTRIEHLDPNVKVYTSKFCFFLSLVCVALVHQFASSIRFHSVCRVCFNICSFIMFSMEEFVIFITRYSSDDKSGRIRWVGLNRRSQTDTITGTT
jgi:hypothetical protein